MRIIFTITLLLTLTTARAADESLPRLAQIDNRTTLLVDNKPFIMLTGELKNSSSSSLEYLDPIWPKLQATNLNTVIASVSWELLEPTEGQFDFTLVDGILAGARKHNLRLVLIWFASYKNAQSTYAPAWVLSDRKRFPRIETKPGRESKTITPLSEEALKADARAFATLMKHLRKVDPQHTVIMMQIENECGITGTPRDLSPAAEEQFKAPVPAELLTYLDAHKKNLRPELAAAYKPGGKSWPDSFGPMADEAFMAFHFARFLNHVAQAGKSEYPLPMYANAWIVQAPTDPPGKYPSGGPVSRVHDIYHAAAPQLDLLAPDIYLKNFEEITDDYAKPDNPLFIPESKIDDLAPQRAWYAIVEKNALGFAPFGIDDMRPEDAALLADMYKTLAAIQPLQQKYANTDQLKTLYLPAGAQPQTFEFAGYQIRARPQFIKPRAEVDAGGILKESPAATASPPAVAMLIAQDASHLLIAGYGLRIDLASATKSLDFYKIEEGAFLKNIWTPARHLNGDENNITLRRPTILRITLYPN